MPFIRNGSGRSASLSDEERVRGLRRCGSPGAQHPRRERMQRSSAARDASLLLGHLGSNQRTRWTPPRSPMESGATSRMPTVPQTSDQVRPSLSTTQPVLHMRPGERLLAACSALAGGRVGAQLMNRTPPDRRRACSDEALAVRSRWHCWREHRPCAERTEAKRGDFNVFLRGGVGGYTGDLEDVTATGPAWGLTLNVQPTNFLGFELGYDGSRNGVERRPRCWTVLRSSATAAAALLKVALPFIEKVKPFVGAGLGVSYVDVSGDAAGPLPNRHDGGGPAGGRRRVQQRRHHRGRPRHATAAGGRGLRGPRQRRTTPRAACFDVTATLGGRF